MNAILYIRTSTNDQKNSIENQQKQLNEYCETHNIKVKPTDVYRDFGFSGKNTTGRPAFTEMMERITSSQDKIADMVLCTKLDRFARSVVDLRNSLETITNKGMKLCTMTETFDPLTPTGKFFLNILGSVAEFERDIINERTREGFYAAVAKGEKLCHRPQKELPKKKILDLIDKGISATAISKQYDVSSNTMKNRLNEWGYQYIDKRWVKVN